MLASVSMQVLENRSSRTKLMGAGYSRCTYNGQGTDWLDLFKHRKDQSKSQKESVTRVCHPLQPPPVLQSKLNLRNLSYYPSHIIFKNVRRSLCTNFTYGCTIIMFLATCSSLYVVPIAHVLV